MSDLTAIASGPSTSSPSDGSRTQIVHDSQPRADDGSSNPSHDQENTPHGVLRLRGGPKSKPAVVWKEDVIDNENMGKKSSKSTSHANPRMLCKTADQYWSVACGGISLLYIP